MLDRTQNLARSVAVACGLLLAGTSAAWADDPSVPAAAAPAPAVTAPAVPPAPPPPPPAPAAGGPQPYKVYLNKVVDGSRTVTANGRSVTVWSDTKGQRERVAFLGLTTSAADATLRDQLRLPRGVGLVVNGVEANSPAAAAGVQAHDVLTKVDDQWAVNEPQLGVLVRMHKAGEAITLSVVRHGEVQQLKATLTEHEAFVTEAADPFGPGAGGFQATGPVTFTTATLPKVAVSDVNTVVADVIKAEGTDKDAPNVLIKVNGQMLKINAKAGGPHMLVINEAGKTTFDGPYDLAAHPDALPPEVRAVLDKYKGQIETGLGGGPNSQRRVVIVESKK